MRCSVLFPQPYFTRKTAARLHSFIPVCAGRFAAGMVTNMKKVLGLSFGRKMNSTEVMVKHALDACKEAGHEVRFIWNPTAGSEGNFYGNLKG